MDLPPAPFCTHRLRLTDLRVWRVGRGAWAER